MKKKKASSGGQAEARVGLHPGVRAGEVCQPGKQAPDPEAGMQRGPLRSYRRTVEAEDAVRLERRCGTEWFRHIMS